MFSISTLVRFGTALGIIACTACTGMVPKQASNAPAPAPFYTLTAEIALSRHEARAAALQYAAVAQAHSDASLLERATDVTQECLQPSLTLSVAARWLKVDPAAVEAHHAAARAALELNDIEQSAAQYRLFLTSSKRGLDPEFAVLETEFTGTDNIYGARQVADRLAEAFPHSAAALRIQSFAALRADDPAAAVRAFQAALAVLDAPVPDAPAGPDAPGTGESAGTAPPSRHELVQGLWRARILAGDPDGPLAEARAVLDHDASTQNRMDYALLLLAAQQSSAARAELTLLTRESAVKPLALRLLGLIDFEEGKLPEAGARFAELLNTGQYMDDALYYLALIAERHEDLERALRLYSQVQNGDNAVTAFLRAANILRAHGAAPAAEELLDQLVDDEPQRAPEILVARARIYSDAGDVPQAMAVLEQAEEQYPDSIPVRYAMATTSEEQGDITAALHVLKDLAARRPTDPAALNAYGYTLANHGRQLGVARKLIEQAHAQAPQSAAILDSLGWVLFKQGQADQGLPYLNAAFAEEHDGDIAAHLGEVLWRLGRRSDAELVWSEAGKVDSDNQLLKTTEQRLRSLN